MRKKLLAIALIALSAISFTAKAQQRYCNPLSMPVGPGGNATGDVSIFYDEGKYYMYCTGGGAWVSEDLTNWTFHHVDNIPIAPDVHKYNGKYYLTGNDITIWESDSPLGPFKDMGPFKNTGDPKYGWKVPFDSMLFVDDDNTPYLFWPGRGRTGIYGVELDKNDLTRFVSEPTHLFSYNPMHWYEHMGERNEYQNVAWIEGPWVFKRNGIYYCCYSCSGTQWKSYAAGYYSATSPLGPYTNGNNGPFLRNTEGIVTGPSHGSVIKGPDGNFWAFYTVVLSNPPGGRKIGMDKIEFDDYGNMSVKVTDTPQLAPNAKPGAKVSKSIPLSVNKVTQTKKFKAFSSEQPGFFAAYAVDDYSGTYWKPEPSDKQPWLMLDLSPAELLNVIDLFEVDALRILFVSGNRRDVGTTYNPVYQYKLEGSMDGEKFFTLVDKTGNQEVKEVYFDEFESKQCRYVKLTFTGWPKGMDLSVIDATVYGKYTGYIPPEDPQENDRFLYNY